MDDTEQQRTPEAKGPRRTYWEMLDELTPKVPRPDPDGEEVFQTVGTPEATPPVQEAVPPVEEQRSSAAKDRQRALTARLMEQVCEPANLNRAYERVMANKGRPGLTA